MIIRKVLKFLLRRGSRNNSLKFKHGLRFRNNGHIDTLNPQFVEIGNNFISAPGSLITAHDASTFLFSRKYRVEKIIIGDNVFLGANSVILPGVNIGDNVIVGAGAVVAKDIPSNSVFACNPARFICSIDEYIKKCEQRDVLYGVPHSFLEEYKLGKPISLSNISEFQNRTFNEYKRRIGN